MMLDWYKAYLNENFLFFDFEVILALLATREGDRIEMYTAMCTLRVTHQILMIDRRIQIDHLEEEPCMAS